MVTHLCVLYCTVPILKDQSRGDRPQVGQDQQMGQTLTQIQDGGTEDKTELLEEPLRYSTLQMQRCYNGCKVRKPFVQR